MTTPYRNVAPRPESPYKIWTDLRQRSLLVRLGLSAQRWGLRTTASTPPISFREKDYPNLVDACEQLGAERMFANRNDIFYVVDRKTGKCFSPPPWIVDKIVLGQPLVCELETKDTHEIHSR